MPTKTLSLKSWCVINFKQWWMGLLHAVMSKYTELRIWYFEWRENLQIRRLAAELDSKANFIPKHTKCETDKIAILMDRMNATPIRWELEDCLDYLSRYSCGGSMVDDPRIKPVAHKYCSEWKEIVNKRDNWDGAVRICSDRPHGVLISELVGWKHEGVQVAVDEY